MLFSLQNKVYSTCFPKPSTARRLVFVVRAVQLSILTSKHGIFRLCCVHSIASEDDFSVSHHHMPVLSCHINFTARHIRPVSPKSTTVRRLKPAAGLYISLLSSISKPKELTSAAAPSTTNFCRRSCRTKHNKLLPPKLPHQAQQTSAAEAAAPNTASRCHRARRPHPPAAASFLLAVG